MAKARPQSNEPEGTQFVVDLGQIELTDEDVEGVQNEITRVALAFARQKNAPAAKKKEPYVRILHVKTTHVRTVKK